MDKIFHEKQEGCLCAQHCLNALLQGNYFTPVDLATHAQQLDEQERLRMAESGVDRKEYHDFLQQPSGNMDDSGFFSVQVITAALDCLNLELVPYNSQEPPALEAQKAPEEMQAYICNYREHWFTIRRLGNQWFNLNSLLSGPQLISNTYLSVFLAQLQHEGYSIFVVLGALPPCDADKEILEHPVVQTTEPKPVKQTVKSVGYRLGSSADDEDLQKAIQLSLGQRTPPQGVPPKSPTIHEKYVDRILVETVGTNEEEDEDEVDMDLQIALRLSLEHEHSKRLSEKEKLEGSLDDILQVVVPIFTGPAGFTERRDSADETQIPVVDISAEDDATEDEELQRALELSLETRPPEEDSDGGLRRALQMSLEACPSTSGASRPGPSSAQRSTELDQSEVRAARLRYLDRAATSSGKM